VTAAKSLLTNFVDAGTKQNKFLIVGKILIIIVQSLRYVITVVLHSCTTLDRPAGQVET